MFVFELRGCLLVALCLACLPSEAGARAIRVERDGSGDVVEIHDAIESAAPGDTILIGPGRWDVQRAHTPTGSQTAIAWVFTPDLTILGRGNGETIVGPADPVQAGSTAPPAGIVVDVSGYGCTIRGITFVNTYFPLSLLATARVSDCVFAQPISVHAPALAILGADDVTVADCTFAAVDGIGVFGESRRTLIERCHFDDVTFEGTGVYVSREGLLGRPEPGAIGVLRDCVFDRASVAVQTGFSADLRVEACEVLRAEAAAFSAPDASMQIVRCTVRPTPRYVVAARDSWNVEVRDSHLAGGQIVTINNPGSFRFVVTNCNIVDVRSMASRNESDGPGEVLDLRGNWWGTTDRARIQRWNHDAYGRTILFPARSEPIGGFAAESALHRPSVEADPTFQAVRARSTGLLRAGGERVTLLGSSRFDSGTALRGLTRAATVTVPLGPTPSRELPPPSDLLASADPGFAWIDEDADGNLDFVASGYDYFGSAINIYRNQTTSWLDVGSLGLPSRRGPGLRFVDWDLDGALDVVTTLLNGRAGVWLRDGTRFVETAPKAERSRLGSLDVGDLDGDGDPDALVAGHERRPVRLENVAGGIVIHELVLPMLSDAIVALFDADTDGDLDALLMGWDGFDRRAFLLANDGAAGFVEVAHPFAPLNMGDVATGDVDGDGDADVVLMGLSAEGPVTHLYRNEGDLRFSRMDVDLPQLYDGGVDLGDVNNDGRLDLALSGADTEARPVTRIHLNAGTQWPNAQPILTGLRASDLEWGDVDADGKLDLVYGGIDAAPDLRIFMLGNVIATEPNDPPSPPNRPIVFREGDEVVFRWEHAEDDHTAVASLTYELWVGTTANTADVMPVAARIPDGRRLIPQSGNVGSRTEHRLRIPRDVEIHAGVQSIDSGFRASEFVPFPVLPAEEGAVVPVPTASVDRSVRMRRHPVSGDTEVSYLADAGVRARVSVYDVRGRRVDVVIDEVGTGERRTVQWTGEARSRGVYFVRVEIGGLVRTFKTSVLR